MYSFFVDHIPPHMKICEICMFFFLNDTKKLYMIVYTIGLIFYNPTFINSIQICNKVHHNTTLDI